VAQTPAKVSDMQYQFALQLGGVVLVTILYGANLLNLDRTEILLSPLAVICFHASKMARIRSPDITFRLTVTNQISAAGSLYNPSVAVAMFDLVLAWPRPSRLLF
jgi:hypothetical protein